MNLPSKPIERISIHALLAESDTHHFTALHDIFISIHALLAESDAPGASREGPNAYFYPRSPCGERPFLVRLGCKSFLFLSTLSLRRATVFSLYGVFYVCIFLSTLSLRRATIVGGAGNNTICISIHALLAESDMYACSMAQTAKISIHALLAESDRHLLRYLYQGQHFYPRSPCGERH